MPSRSDRSRISKCGRKAALLALLPLVACATDELALAPAAPERPWAIPPGFEDLPRPGIANAARLVDRITPHPGRSDRGRDDKTRDNAVSIDPTRHYDLAGLIDLAERNNPETREAWERARQAALAVGLAETSYLPQISAEAIGGFQHTPLPIPAALVPKGYFIADTRELIPALATKWLLFDFGQREGTVAAARANAFVADVAFTGAHQKLIYAVSRDYFALGAARGRLRVAQQSLKMAEVVQDVSETRRAHGLATVVEEAQARRQTAQARFNLERAAGVDRTAYAALIASMGIAPSTPIETADSTELRLPPAPSGNVDKFVQDALEGRPDIIAALGKVRAAERMLSSARATYYPTIGLEARAYENAGGLSTDGSRYYSVNEPGASILLKLSVPLYDGGLRDARVATARSEVAAARDTLNHTRDTSVQQVTDAYDALRTSFAEYTASLTLNQTAQTAYDAALDAYRHGVGTYTDVVTGETALSQAQSEKEDAHANVFTAAAALAFSTGAILTQP